MIASADEYRVTLASARELEAAIARLDTEHATDRSFFATARRSSLESELFERYRSLQTYERSFPGLQADRQIHALNDLGWRLILERVRAGFRQSDLARVLAIPPEELARIEAERYASASLAFVLRVVDALGITLGVAEKVA